MEVTKTEEVATEKEGESDFLLYPEKRVSASGLCVVAFDPSHFFHMNLRREDREDLAGLDVTGLLTGWQGGRTVLENNEVVFIYGYSGNAGTVSLWALSSLALQRFPLFVTRLARAGTKLLFRAGAHRIEVYCHKNNPRSLAWLTRSLDFRVEGLMRCCGSNRQDRYLLAKTLYDVEGKLWEE